MMRALAAQTTVVWGDHEGPLVTKLKTHEVIACRVCGFRHVVPLPDPSELESAYREKYYTEEKPTFLAHAAEDADWGEIAARDRLEGFERLLPAERRHLLDIGSGPGFFLKTAQARGWRVLGIEPSRQAAAHARTLGVQVVEGFFNAETAAGLGQYDVVHLNNVLEHVPNALEIVCLARDLLSPGGLLCLNVPNDFSSFQTAAQKTLDLKEWWVAPPHHLNYFDFDSLTDLLPRLGLPLAERTTTFPMELFLLMGMNYTADSALGRSCHAQRKRFDLALEQSGFIETRRSFYRALAAAGLGREIVIIAKKP
jgi:2-polyprenyl-3-methyl-5-hydroxy-6-metoxy-1,4-benzoquinol methylase